MWLRDPPGNHDARIGSFVGGCASASGLLDLAASLSAAGNGEPRKDRPTIGLSVDEIVAGVEHASCWRTCRSRFAAAVGVAPGNLACIDGKSAANLPRRSWCVALGLLRPSGRGRSETLREVQRAVAMMLNLIGSAWRKRRSARPRTPDFYGVPPVANGTESFLRHGVAAVAGLINGMYAVSAVLLVGGWMLAAWDGGRSSARSDMATGRSPSLWKSVRRGGNPWWLLLRSIRGRNHALDEET